MTDNTADDLSELPWLLLDRVEAQSGVEPRGAFLHNDRVHPGWNRPLTAVDREWALALFGDLPEVLALLERDDYDAELHARIEANFLANREAAHERLDLLIDLLKTRYPDAAAAILVRSDDNERLELNCVIGPGNEIITATADGTPTHQYTIRDLIEQLGPEPDWDLDKRLEELWPTEKGRRRFKLPLVPR